MPKNPKELFRFWDELKRRKVVKASLVYLAVAYTIMQASDLIFPRFGLPDWTVTFVIILLVIVFILVVVLTWVYDITPEGIKVTKPEESDEEGNAESIPEASQGQTKSEITGKSLGDEELRQKVISLESQLEEAKKISYKRLFAAGFKKLFIPVIIIALMLFLLFNKQQIRSILGGSNAARESAKAHNLKAKMYIDTRDYESARSEIELALQSDPGYSYAWGNLAVISYKLGDPEKAILQTTKAIELDPGNSYAPYNIALALNDKKDFEQAIRWYKTAIRIDSAKGRDSVYTAACSALGNVYNSVRRPIEATIVLRRAMNRYPASKYEYLIYRNLGNAYLLQEQSDSALKYLELSNNLMPHQPETNFYLAKAFEATGEMTKCIESWKAYIKLEQDSTMVRDAQEHLKKITKAYLQEIIK